MAKGQVRSNKETKKPKQDKKSAAPASTFGNAAAQASSQISEAKKHK
ncbi:hypothetical protein HQ393_11575 [Chitinibacter bivalviorum]|uniref:Uncharacterized protein n=1 Tax=Chitinibacter bivalviorum TaxID=2739434 RepID=A0A7H9BLD0_9NEIS|nr:hypothetical protein [Chitinibacter bivalviorum]QLG88821.1 hypothetical protein HQ393_11575 [Chitinibacter bivalviorum]